MPNHINYEKKLVPGHLNPLAVDSLYRWPQWALSRGDAVALLFEQPLQRRLAVPRLGQLSWGQLACQVERLAQELQGQGFAPGDRLVHASGNTHRGVLVALASLAIGTIEVPIDPLLDQATQQSLARSVGGRWLAPGTADAVAEDGCETAPGDENAATLLLQRHAQRAHGEASLILFTSGTGGKSKAVTLSRRNLDTNAAAKLQAVPQSVQDVRVCLLPICHAYARTCDLATWLLSGSALAITSGWDGWQRVAPHVRPTMANMVPSVALRLLGELPECSRNAADEALQPSQAQRLQLSRLRTLGCGGAALPVEAFDRFVAQGITVIQGYGMTEASPVICSATPRDARPGWVGRPVRGCHIRIDDDGRLWVRGDGVMLGYWNDPEETDRQIVDGWLDTGDLVEVDPADGQLRILGRVDDRITLPSARKIHPAPIEQRVLGLGGVLHALLVPAGRHVELWIDVRSELRDRSDWQHRVDALLADLPSWQRPRQVIVLSQALADVPAALTRKGTPIRSNVIPHFTRQPDHALSDSGSPRGFGR